MAQAAGLPMEEPVSKAKQSRSEKKARKAMSKLGAYQQCSGTVHSIVGSLQFKELCRNVDSRKRYLGMGCFTCNCLFWSTGISLSAALSGHNMFSGHVFFVSGRKQVA